MVYEADICASSDLQRSLEEWLNNSSCNDDCLEESSTKTELRKCLDFSEPSASSSNSNKMSSTVVVPIRLVKAVHKAINQGEYILYSEFGRVDLSYLMLQGERLEPIYLHEMLKGCELHLPEFTPPPRSAELEARIQRLKAQADEREYKQMTKNVSSPENFYTENLGVEIKQMNNQIIAMVNFVVTVVGAFAFGYKASEASMEVPNVAIQLIVGMVLGTIVFFADLYFLIKKTM